MISLAVDLTYTIRPQPSNGVVPRPIAFVSSESKSGVRNLAPFSYFSVVTHAPPLISFSVSAKAPGEPKDTTANILETKR